MKLLMLAILLSGSAVLAIGNTHGNGGDVMICTDEQGNESFKILDLYEIEIVLERHGGKIDLGSTDLNYIEKARHVLKNFESIDPYTSDILIAYLDNFESEAAIYPTDLEDIDDSEHTGLPPGDCRLQQIANQRPDPFPFQNRYTIDSRLWEKLDEINKAVLVIHEIVYRLALDAEHTDSRYTRHFTGLLLANLLPTIEPRHYLYLITRLRRALTQFYYVGLPIIYQEDSSISDSFDVVHNPDRTMTAFLFEEVSVDVGQHQIHLERHDKVNIDEWGNIRTLWFKGEKPIGLAGKTYACQETLGFYPDGELLSCRNKNLLAISGETYEIWAEELEFNEGAVRFAKDIRFGRVFKEGEWHVITKPHLEFVDGLPVLCEEFTESERLSHCQ